MVRTNMLQKLFALCRGRHTAFAIFFALSMTALAAFGKLTGDYVAGIGAVQALLFAHSVKEDYFANKGASCPK
jgi:hypothetical protein